MSKLPEHFQYWQDSYEGKIPDAYNFQPFSYDKDAESFNIGLEVVAAQTFDPYGYSTYDQEHSITKVEELTQYPVLLHVIDGPVAGPKLHEWALTHHSEIASETVPVMHAVYQMFYEEPIPLETGGGFMSFEAGIRENGAIGLQVLGSCACLGPKYSLGLFREGIEQGFAEYELHNADTQAQRSSLYAGLGHLAKLASET